MAALADGDLELCAKFEALHEKAKKLKPGAVSED